MFDYIFEKSEDIRKRPFSFDKRNLQSKLSVRDY